LIDVLRFSLMMIKDYGYRRQMASVLRPSLRTLKGPECLVRLKNLAVLLPFYGTVTFCWTAVISGRLLVKRAGFYADFWLPDFG
jgi:hypothetical protein